MDGEKDYLASLDRRLADHDQKLTSQQRDYTELLHENRQILERINQGLSPSVNAVRQENSEIRLQLADLSHKMDINTIEMKTMARETAELTRNMLHNFEKSKIEPVEKEVGFMKKTLVYGLVGALIVFVAQKGLNMAWEKVFPKSSEVLVR